MPINAPQSRPQAPAQGVPSRPQAPARPAQPGQQAPAGQPRPAQAQPAAPRNQPPAGTQRQPVPPRGIPPRTTGSHGRLPAAQQRQPIDLATRLDGQRGWLAQIDRSLRKRSIIALVLTCLAVGAAAAAIYIAVTKNSDGDRIDALQTRIESLEAAAGIPSTDTTESTTTIPGTDSLTPETGATLPDGTTLPSTGTTDGSGLVTPAE